MSTVAGAEKKMQLYNRYNKPILQQDSLLF